MQVRGSIARGSLIALALTLIPVTADSAQKITPGSTCKVLNQKVVYQNKTYTCIKSGKKLLWNKLACQKVEFYSLNLLHNEHYFYKYLTNFLF
jgi:hypothetical protein